MDKIFLSHSSIDKPYVKYIAEEFGKDQCAYDEFCFEDGMKNIDEIFREMGRSSIFVIFISDNSLKSEWVKKELAIAEDRLNHDTQRISQIFPIIIDPRISHDDLRIPQFLKKGFLSYNLRVIASKFVACRKIKAQQTKYLLENHLIEKGSYDCFYGRDEEITRFKKEFDSGNGIKCLTLPRFYGHQERVV